MSLSNRTAVDRTSLQSSIRLYRTTLRRLTLIRLIAKIKVEPGDTSILGLLVHDLPKRSLSAAGEQRLERIETARGERPGWILQSLILPLHFQEEVFPRWSLSLEEPARNRLKIFRLFLQHTKCSTTNRIATPKINRRNLAATSRKIPALELFPIHCKRSTAGPCKPAKVAMVAKTKNRVKP